jgi:hypothetical protein
MAHNSDQLEFVVLIRVLLVLLLVFGDLNIFGFLNLFNNLRHLWLIVFLSIFLL